MRRKSMSSALCVSMWLVWHQLMWQPLHWNVVCHGKWQRKSKFLPIEIKSQSSVKFQSLFGFFTWHFVTTNKIRSAEITHDIEGFYKTKHNRHSGRHSVCLALLVDPEGAKNAEHSPWRMKALEFQTHRPHTGTQVRLEKFEEVLKKGDKITPEQAKKLWTYHQDSSVRQCSHMFWDGSCKNKTIGLDCDVSGNSMSS